MLWNPKREYLGGRVDKFFNSERIEDFSLIYLGILLNSINNTQPKIQWQILVTNRCSRLQRDLKSKSLSIVSIKPHVFMRLLDADKTDGIILIEIQVFTFGDYLIKIN